MPLSLYLHVPFCTHRCAYCDFNTYAGQQAAIPAYVDALCAEIQAVGAANGKAPFPLSVDTIFFGGGTPTLLSPAQFGAILAAIRSNFMVHPGAEITTEANPGTVSLDALETLRALGINRISFGVQSANPEELRMLEREHSFFDVINAVAWARRAGFDNLNLDLIYGLPEQRMATWQASLKRAVDLHPEHLSLYALTLEHGTPFGRWTAQGLLPLPDPDLAAEMYEWAGVFLAGQGYLQYEISNWAREGAQAAPPLSGEGHRLLAPGYACRHNLQYWRSLPYLGLGAGAHGYANGWRYSNALRIATYIDRLAAVKASTPYTSWPLSPATVNSHENTRQDDMDETMIMGLRLTGEGISDDDFRARFGASLIEIYGAEIGRLIGLGLLEWVDPSSSRHPLNAEAAEATLPTRESRGQRLRLTSQARLIANQVFIAFVR